MKSNWTYQGNKNFVFPKGTIGFVYEIIYKNGFRYIGKLTTHSKSKVLAKPENKHKDGYIRTFNKRVKLNKTELANRTTSQVNKGVTTTIKSYDEFRKISGNSWKDYEGSSENTKGLKVFSKNIIEFGTKAELTYLEAKYLFKEDVLNTDMYYNNNILGSFHGEAFKNEPRLDNVITDKVCAVTLFVLYEALSSYEFTSYRAYPTLEELYRAVRWDIHHNLFTRDVKGELLSYTTFLSVLRHLKYKGYILELTIDSTSSCFQGITILDKEY